MRQTEAVGKFGEYFVTMTLQNLGYETDRIDAAGIDLMAYRKGRSAIERYGLSVKTRNAYHQPNSNLRLQWNDIVYTHEQASLRGGIPAYAVVWNTETRMDVLIMTQEYLLKDRGYESIESFRSANPGEGSVYFRASEKNRDEWIRLYRNHTPGILYAARYTAE